MDGLGAARRFGFVLVAGVLLGGFADRAQALEAFDGKLQAHGFVEIQARGLDRSYAEEFDLSQWYNVLNLEVEFDLIEDGWGPFDLLSGFIRAEGRYDCIYTGGCGMFPSVNTYGNKSRDLPLRLRDGETKVFSGVVDMTDRADPPGVLPLVPPEARDPVQWSVAEVVETERGSDLKDPNTFTETNLTCPTTGFRSGSVQPPISPPPAPGTWTGCVDNRPDHTEIVKRKGFPGFDTLFDLEGADGELHEFQDYASVNRLFADPVFQDFQDSLGVNASDWSFYDQRIRDPNFVIPTPAGGTGDNTQRWRYQYGGFFRGLVDERDDPGYYTLLPVNDWRFTFRSFPGPEPNGEYLPMGPWLPKNFFGTTAALDDRANPLRGRRTPTLMAVNGVKVRTDGTRYNAFDCGDGLGAATVDCNDKSLVPIVDPVDSRLFQLEKLLGAVQGNYLLYDPSQDPDGPEGYSPTRLWNLNPYPNGSAWKGVFGNTLFGGDYSGIIPCWDTNKTIANRGAVSNSPFVDQLASSGISGNTLIRSARYGCIPLTNVRVTGGDGELPMRVAPDFSNLSNTEYGRAQGLYLPSYAFLDYIENGGSINDHQFNLSETDRAFNRGYAQRETYELKEAYLDMEFLESRLWVRAGIQNIVWGKTELFRTTDQFNPQDFALSSLPSLEEARIALLSARAVYSFYDVGPLEDVRFELAVNFDRFQPTDLGACGEPYTLDVVCALTLGTAIHGVTGLGVAGIDAYPDGYKDVDGLEFGGRLEFRWDRFSFAIMDFYGYSDFPYPDVITYYERNVDPSTGMPRKGGATGSCANRAGFVATNVFTSDAATEFLIQAGNPALEAANPGVAAVQPVGLRDVIASGQVAPGGLDAANDDWWRRKEAYGLLGIGTDPDCLKPGGAPGLANENRYDAALAPSLEAFLETNPVSAYSNATGAAADQLAGSASTFMVETVGGTAGDQIQWTNVGVSQDYALRYHPANQQLFHFICSATVSIAVALAPGACAWNLWGTDAKLIQDFEGPPFGDLIGGGFAGNQTNGYYFNFYNQIISATKGETINAALTVPVAPLNSDVRDGRTTSMVQNFGDTSLNFRGLFFGQDRLKDTPRDTQDFLTLDNTLTWQQKATLGCGPAYGTRCDTGEATVRVRLKTGSLAGELDIESEFTARTRPDEYEIVDANGVACDPTNLDPCRVWGRGGGVDFLNAEASVILQSMPGFEGTEGGTNTQYTDDGLPTGNILFPNQWITWAADTAQPGTVGVPGKQVNDGAGGKTVDRATQPFVGGVVCTRYAPGHPDADANGLVILPGCRGAISATVDDNDPGNINDNVIDVRFDEGYSPSVDGCVFGRKMVDGFLTYWVRAVNADGTLNTELQNELYETCFNANQPNIEGAGPTGDPGIMPGTDERANAHFGDVTWFSYSRRPVLNPLGIEVIGSRLTLQDGVGAGHLFHPLAGCENSSAFNPKLPAGDTGPDTPLRRVQFAQNLCQSTLRNFESEFVSGDASVFRNELAAISFNFMSFLVISSCNSVSGGDDLAEQECFRPDTPWTVGRCSLSTPQYCRNVRSFLGVGGIGRNDARAGGNPQFGRRDFLWQSGADLSLKYARRNVFGISADFAEDNTKTNWGVEFTWIAPTPWVDNNSMTSTTDSSAFNLTISVDRPTFINFLNANRTFFFNTQWFFNYLPDHTDGFTTFGDPFNVLFTFAVFTGYYQDRLLPQLVTVYDFGSQSGGFLPQLGYRFTEAFSVTFGVSFFVGRSQYVPMPLRGFAPRANRAGPHKYEDGVQRLLANFMRRDEAWMRLRWTF